MFGGYLSSPEITARATVRSLFPGRPRLSPNHRRFLWHPGGGGHLGTPGWHDGFTCPNSDRIDRLGGVPGDLTLYEHLCRSGTCIGYCYDREIIQDRSV